jgi:hypothetical protein
MQSIKGDVNLAYGTRYLTCEFYYTSSCPARADARASNGPRPGGLRPRCHVFRRAALHLARTAVLPQIRVPREPVFGPALPLPQLPPAQRLHWPYFLRHGARLASSFAHRLTELYRVSHVAGSLGSQGCLLYAPWRSATHSLRFASPLSGSSKRRVGFYSSITLGCSSLSPSRVNRIL